MKSISKYLAFLLGLCLVLSSAVSSFAESYTGDVLRLLRFDGDVAISDAQGNDRFVMENVRFSSGETLKTGTSSAASVSLDTDRIVSLDEETTVAFQQQGSHMEMHLEQGELFLDVSSKLDENESLDIHTTTLTVGIRGTIVAVSAHPDESGKQVSCLMVLEGTAQASFGDQAIPVQAGEILYVPGLEKDAAYTHRVIEAQDISEFVKTQSADPSVSDRIPQLPGLQADTKGSADPYAAGGDWTVDTAVTFIAQSASKIYDGTPLTRTDAVLVTGLPDGFTFSASAGGSITNAGNAENPVTEYAIFNESGEVVTNHFTGIETVSGTLVVDASPMTVWTGSNQKIYDGYYLREPSAGLSLLPPSTEENIACLLPETDENALYGISGSVIVHGTDPLTGKTGETTLAAGQKLTVRLDENGLSFVVEPIPESGIPESMLHLFAQRSDLLEPAAAAAGWDLTAVQERIGALESASDTIPDEDLLHDLANVQLQIDSAVTDYSIRAMTDAEAHFTQVAVNDLITVTATGSRLNPGRVPNTYEINWGSIDPANYELQEKLGFLWVYDPPATPEPQPTPKTHEHTEGSIISVTVAEATCEQNGLREETVYCSGCNEIIRSTRVTIPALGHTGGTATCQSPAICTRCGKAYGPLGSHQFQTVRAAVAATCTAPGTSALLRCSVCGTEQGGGESAAALGHSWGGWVQTKAATCLEDGTETRTCQRCKATETRSLAKTGHTPKDPVRENVVPAECLKNGSHDDVVYCAVCGTQISRTTVPDRALGHTGGTATCIELAVCTRCGEEYGGYGDHHYELIESVKPNCSNAGYSISRCTICNDELTEETDPDPDAHEFDEYGICIYCSISKSDLKP